MSRYTGERPSLMSAEEIENSEANTADVDSIAYMEAPALQFNGSSSVGVTVASP